MSQGKPKLVVAKRELTLPVDSASGELALSEYQEPARRVSPMLLINNAVLAKVPDTEKHRFVVIKFAYLLFDPRDNAVLLINRSKSKHSHMVGENSILISSSIDPFYGAINAGSANIVSSRNALASKLGAYADDFELPARRAVGTRDRCHFSYFVFRQSGDRHYAFFIHIARLRKRSRFPRNRFILGQQGASERHDVQGWFPLSEAEELVSDTKFAVDRFALSRLLGKPHLTPGLDSQLVGTAPLFAALWHRLKQGVKAETTVFGFGFDWRKVVGPSTRN